MSINVVNNMWSVFDELKGYISALECVEIGVPLLTLNYMEKQHDIYVVTEEAKWSEIIREGFELKKRIVIAFQEIEKQNVPLKGILTSVWSLNSSRLEKVDDAVLHRLVLRLDRIETDDYGRLVEELLRRAGEESGKRGEIFAPISLVKLVPNLLNIHEDYASLYDGVVGYGRMACEACNLAQEKGINVNIFGQEKNSISRGIAMMNLILHGKHDAVIALGDTLRDPQLKDGNRLKTFDYVMMEPPFGLKDWGHEEAEADLYGRFAYGVPGKAHGDMAFILHALSSLKEKGKAVVVVPQGVLFRGALDGKIRSRLIQDDLLEAVIGFPSGIYQYTAISVAILVFNKQKNHQAKGKIFFVNAEELGEKKRGRTILDKEDVAAITESYLKKKEQEGFSKWVSINEIIENDFNLSLKRYFTSTEVEIESKIGVVRLHLNHSNDAIHTVPLRDIAQLFRGMNAPKEAAELERATHKMILLSDVQDDILQLENLTPIEIHDAKRGTAYAVQQGDVLLSSRGTASKIAVVPETEENLIISHNFIGIRPNLGVDPYFIKLYLESPIGQYHLSLRKKGEVMAVISTKDIEDLPIPYLSLEKQAQIVIESKKADEELAYQVQKAKEEHKKVYLDLYNKLGITLKDNEM